MRTAEFQSLISSQLVQPFARESPCDGTLGGVATAHDGAQVRGSFAHASPAAPFGRYQGRACLPSSSSQRPSELHGRKVRHWSNCELVPRSRDKIILQRFENRLPSRCQAQLSSTRHLTRCCSHSSRNPLWALRNSSNGTGNLPASIDSRENNVPNRQSACTSRRIRGIVVRRWSGDRQCCPRCLANISRRRQERLCSWSPCHESPGIQGLAEVYSRSLRRLRRSSRGRDGLCPFVPWSGFVA